MIAVDSDTSNEDDNYKSTSQFIPAGRIETSVQAHMHGALKCTQS